MTNEQLNQYYSKDADKKQCWVSKDHNCPLKEQCNGLVKPECKEHIDNEEACHVVDKMIEWYYQVEEPEFLLSLRDVRETWKELVIPSSVSRDI